MSLPDEFIGMARALSFYRKFKWRRSTLNSALKGWSDIGSGYYGEVWSHEYYPDLVVKISGRAGFGVNAVNSNEPALDGWPVFAEHCLANPHPNLPKIMHFERLSLGVSFGIMPRYAAINQADWRIIGEWRDYLEGGKGSPSWLWPIIGMRSALGMQVDLHGDNVMRDTETGEYIMTDPFSAVGACADSYYME